MDVLAKVKEFPKNIHAEPSISSSLPHLILLALLSVVLYHLHKDYHAYLALGPGGTPATISGYLRVKTLSFFTLRQPHLPGPTPAHLLNTSGHLIQLPSRGFPRPNTRGIAPHRQTTQRASKMLYAQLAASIQQMGIGNPAFELGTSCFEKHGTGLFSLSPVKRTCRGEICHAHPSDGSMHMTLHPADAQIVMEAAWGERHPLARGGWFERFVPGGFVMVYAPTKQEDVETLMRIVEAAALWVSGMEIGKGGLEEEKKDSGYVSGEEEEEK